MSVMANNASRVGFDDGVIRITVVDDISEEDAQRLVKEVQSQIKTARAHDKKIAVLLDLSRSRNIDLKARSVAKAFFVGGEMERVAIFGATLQKARLLRDVTEVSAQALRSKIRVFRTEEKAINWLRRKSGLHISPRKALFLAAAVTALGVAWQQAIAPALLKLPDNFSYQASVVSYDNFYDERTAGYEGKTLSDTRFSYKVVDSQDDVLNIKNRFEVSTTSGQKIFAVERTYGVDQETRQHLPGQGDHDRAGFLFAPANLSKQDFTYWHVNYDVPIAMQFQEEEDILGLTTYRYAAEFHADQTQSLKNLPDVGIKKGVTTDVDLQLWVEPRTGHLIKYEDNATAYYYDLASGKRLNPWNQFSNAYNFDSIASHVQQARQEKQQREMVETIIPVLFALVALGLLVWAFTLSGSKMIKTIAPKTWSVVGGVILAVVGLIVGFGWATDNMQLVRLYLPSPAMHPLTTINFLILACVIWLLARNQLNRPIQITVRALLLAVIIFVGCYFVGFIFGLSLGVDTLLQSLGLPSISRISPNTATCLLLVAAALLAALDFTGRKATYITQGMLLVVLGLGVFAVAGYAFSLQTLITMPWFRTMPLHTALLAIIVVISIFLLHPEWEVMKRARKASRHILLAIGVLMALLTATGLFWQLTIANADSRAELRFQADANSLETVVADELTKYVNALHGAQGLFAASNEVNRNEWRAYTDGLRLPQNYPGMTGFSFAQMIPQAQKDKHIAEVRSQGFPEYTITPGGNREIYSSVIYIEPFNERNQRAFGFDMFSEPIRRQAMELARDTGEATLSGKVTLVQETSVDRQAGMLIYLPIYRNGMPLVTVEDRRAALAGFVFTPIRVSSFMQVTLGSQIQGLNISLYDAPSGDEADTSAQLFGGNDSDYASKFSRTDTIHLANRDLTFRFSSSPVYDQDTTETLPSLVLYGGLALSILLALLTFLLSSSRSRALRLAQAMTNSLRQERNLAITNERKIQAILGSIGDGVFVVDPKGNIILFNKAAELISGFSSQEAIGQHFKTILCFLREQDHKPSNDFVATALTGRHAEMAKYTLLKRKDGTLVSVADSAAAVINAHGDIDGAVVVFRDISHEREIEKTKDEFLSIASHELRTPMGAVRANVAMMLDGDFGPVNKDLVEPLTVVHASAVRLVDLINDLLNAARIEAGRMKFTLSDFDAGKVLQSVVNDLKPLAQEKDITLSTQGTNDIVQADPDKLHQVLTNLIGNALKFTDKGSITVTAILHDDMLEVAVTDTGIGIAPEDQKRLFGKFSQVSSQESGKPAGTGLGLYISQQIIRKMGGELWLKDSAPGKGSTFSLSLPIKNSKNALKARHVIDREAILHPDQK